MCAELLGLAQAQANLLLVAGRERKSGGMFMMPSANVRVYRPRQLISVKKKPRRKQPFHLARLSPRQCKKLGVLAMAALVIGVGLTQFLHTRIVELQTKFDQLQSSHTAIADETNRLVSAGSRASKPQVIAMAQKKLKLFEPYPGQVRRM